MIPLFVALATLTATGAEATADTGPDLLTVAGAWEFPETDPGVFRVEAGTLQAQRRSYQSATCVTTTDFENFALEFEFRVGNWSELILLLHAPRNQAWAAGLELVLSDHEGRSPGLDTAGAILNRVAPSKVAVKEDGEWNVYRVRMNWPRLEVAINGEAVQDLDLSAHPELKYSLRRGAIGFRDLLGWGFEVRNWDLELLPDSEKGLVLFNSEDLTGWKEVRPRDAKWRVEDGVIVGDDGNGYLQHEAVVEDFALRLYYQTAPNIANGGVFFRWASDDTDRGHEIQILDVPQTTMPSGSIYNIDRADDLPLMQGDDAWQLLQIFVDGTHCLTRMNGEIVAETDALQAVRPGHITLQMHRENAAIRFKDLVLVKQD